MNELRSPQTIREYTGNSGLYDSLGGPGDIAGNEPGFEIGMNVG
jgi:hypothetical protein